MCGKRKHRLPLLIRLLIWLVSLGIILYAGVVGFVVIREKGVATEVPAAAITLPTVRLEFVEEVDDT